MARHRGGNQPPARPAPVSGPGALSQRTDGGPGQPLRVPTGGDYGDRKALLSQEHAAPMAQASSDPWYANLDPALHGVASTLPPPPQSLSNTLGMADVQPGTVVDFAGPTARPNEPATTPLGMAAGVGAGNVADLLNGLAGSSSAVAQLAAYVNAGRQ